MSQHTTPHESARCSRTNAKSFVDDNVLHVTANQDKNIQEGVLESIAKLDTYTNSNLLALNPEKLHVMVITKQKNIKENFQISIHGKELHHKPSLNILCNIFTSDLTWKEHIKRIVLPSLVNCLQFHGSNYLSDLCKLHFF